jgi:hypothetical protein
MALASRPVGRGAGPTVKITIQATTDLPKGSIRRAGDRRAGGHRIVLAVISQRSRRRSRFLSRPVDPGGQTWMAEPLAERLASCRNPRYLVFIAGFERPSRR